MADLKMSQLTALTALTGDESIPILEDDDGTPVNRIITIEDFLTAIAARVELTAAFEPQGTSFPGSPATGQRYFRTDRGISYYYDGTRWLSVDVLALTVVARDTAVTGLSASTFYGYAALPYLGTYSLYLDRMDYTQQYGGGTINGSNYWKHGVYWDDSATNRTQIALSAAGSSDSPSSRIARSLSIGAVLSGSALALEFYLERTGAPPNVAGAAATVFARLVG